MIDHAVAEFGRRMGLEGFALKAGAAGSGELAGLRVTGLGQLYFERVGFPGHDDEELLVYVVRGVPPHEKDIYREALRLCDYRHGHPLPLTAARHGDQLLLLTRLRAVRLTAAALENAVQFLSIMGERLFTR